MSMRQTPEPPRARPQPDLQLEQVYRLTEAFRGIALAWESIAAGAWSTAAVQSFAALARRTAVDLSTLGCGALDRAVVELVLALDAITVAGTVTAHQIDRVDYALAHIRGVTVQRILAMELASVAVAGGCAPALCEEPCPRCSAHGVCAILRRRAAPPEPSARPAVAAPGARPALTARSR